ncbi:MAG: ABC-F type ribosomal protection protein [Oscillospiraceae bacterium]|nr:ABC-F type ribosomal protection protein [Oscillospiraceae bacterium]
MSMINISNLTFGYDGSSENVFENVSFRIDTDWRLGFTGRNGRGKTTFLRLLLSKLEYSGTISASVDFEYFPYNVSNADNLTIDIIREISTDTEDWKIYREISLLDVSEDVLWRPWNTLSNGEQTKAMLAGMFLRENAFLLIDEPTNHLDMESRQHLGEYLKKKKGFILVSHDRTFLDSCIDHVLAINRTNIEIQSGNFSTWQANKEMRDSFEFAENEKLKREIKSLEAAAKKASEHSDKIERTKIGFDPSKTEKSTSRRASVAAKSKKLMNRAKAMETRIASDIDKKSALLHNIEQSDSLKISPLKFHSARLLEVKNLSVEYDGRIVCENVSFEVMQGERIALCGKNGCGKSSVLKLILGENITHNGEIYGAEKLKISYVQQKTDTLCGTLSEYAESKGIDESLFKAILRKLDFSRELFERKIESYSGGQKKKVLIAGSLCEQAHLYIWDEPLNFIDILSRIQIEELITKFRPTMIFVEHDKTFCENTATKTVVIE